MISRRCVRSAIGFLVTCIGGIAVPAQALAQERAQGVELALVRGDGADACIGSDVLEGEVTHRLGRNPFARPVRQRIECLVQREDSAFVVRLYERDLQGKRLGERVLRVATLDCRDLDDALALAIVLLIDPEYKPAAKSPARQPSPPSYGLGTSGAASELGSHFPIVAPPQSPAHRPKSRVSLLGATGQLRLRPIAAVGNTRVMAGLGGSVGVLPGFGPDLSLSVQRRLRGRLHARVSVHYAPERTAPHIAPTIGFGLTALKAAGCFEGTRQVAVFGCAGLAAGAIHAVVYEPRPVNPGERGWAAVSVDGGARASFGPLVLSIRGQFLVPLVHWKFNLMSGARVFSQAWISPGLAIEVGTHFP
jgi:hypothetical protein